MCKHSAKYSLALPLNLELASRAIFQADFINCFMRPKKAFWFLEILFLTLLAIMKSLYSTELFMRSIIYRKLLLLSKNYKYINKNNKKMLSATAFQPLFIELF